MPGGVTLLILLIGNTTLLWKTQSGKPRVWAEPSEPKALLLNGALPFAHGIITSNDDLV